MSTKTISIRGVPDDAARELAARAAAKGQSLQEYLKAHLIEMVRLPDPDTLVARIRARKAATRQTLDVERILRYLDADRRP